MKNKWLSECTRDERKMAVMQCMRAQQKAARLTMHFRVCTSLKKQKKQYYVN